MRVRAWLWCGGVAALSSCAGRDPRNVDGAPAAPVRDEAAEVTEARALYPRTIDMHQRIVARSCAPNAGVCHNTSNYPDLATTGALLEVVGAWCNLDMPDPTQGFDGCERKGDLLLIPNVMIDEIAWVERTSLDHWQVAVRDPAPSDISAVNAFFYQDVPDTPVFLPAAEWQVAFTLAAGETVGSLDVNGVASDPFIEGFVDEVLASLVPGDPNHNGAFGADVTADAAGDGAGDHAAHVVTAGSLANSYLWGRITGTVPGSRMPLANQPLSNAEYVAVACFIETLKSTAANGGAPAPDDAIDYDGCAFAKQPIPYADDP